jgi:branched-chain amino acid transport system substrate-binding protein
MKIKTTVLIAIAAFLICPFVGAAEIKIGVAAALTGNAAQYGVPIRKGFELAVREINGSGGVSGTELELVIEDEQGKKKRLSIVLESLSSRTKC